MSIRLMLAFALLGILVGESSGRSFVYVSMAGEQRIATYELDEASGQLKIVASVQVSGGPGSLAIDPTRMRLFASIRSAGNLAGFRIADDGKLTLINEVSAGADPSYVTVDHSGNYLLSAYYRAGKVTVHRIGDDGTIGETAIQSITTDEKAHAIVGDPSGKFVYVPHTGPNAIFQFRFDRRRGLLTKNDPLKVIRPESTGPRHLWFHPNKPFAYSSDEQGSSATVYAFNSESGQLTPRQTVSSLPDEFTERNSTSDIEVHPSGKSLYVANRGHDTIACYRIDQVSGQLSRFANTSTEQTTRSFNIDPSGKFLIAAGQQSGKLATFRIDTDGSLDRIGTTEAGSKPWWVQIMQR